MDWKLMVKANCNIDRKRYPYQLTCWLPFEELKNPYQTLKQKIYGRNAIVKSRRIRHKKLFAIFTKGINKEKDIVVKKVESHDEYFNFLHHKYIMVAHPYKKPFQEKFPIWL